MNTKNKLYLVIISLFFISILAIVVFMIFSHSQEEMYRDYSRNQIIEATNAINDIQEVHIFWVAYDYGLWDGMVDLARRPNPSWARENLGEVLYWFDLDALWVMGLDGTITYSDITGCSCHLPDTTFSETLLSKLYHDRYVDFYTLAGDSLILIQGVTIHATGDEERESDPAGYLFMAKCWDHEIMDLLDKLTWSEVGLRPFDYGCPGQEESLKNPQFIQYKHWNGEIIACLEFSKRIDFADLLRTNAMRIIIIMVWFAVFGLLLLSVLLYYWVGKPLDLIADVISKNNTEKIPLLKKSGSDFKRIGLLIEDFLQQKEELKIAKEKAEETDRLKSAFLANVSHEIRTPMSGVTGFAELLQKDNLTDEQRMHYTNVIISSGQHLLHLIDDVLDLSVIESGQIQLANRPFDLEQLMLETHVFFLNNEHIQEKQLNFSMQCEWNNHHGNFTGDRKRIKQVLDNLLTNALKFTTQGGVVFGCRKEQKDEILFFVKDTGPGIPEKYHQFIFDRFTQIHNVYYQDGKRQGTGLGLAICRGLVNIMGGRIWLESVEGSGSTFFFALPVNPESAEDMQGQ